MNGYNWKYRHDIEAVFGMHDNGAPREVCKPCAYLDRDEKQKVGALIAAAPEMLAALEALLGERDAFNSIRPGNVVWDDVHKAISKAKGEL